MILISILGVCPFYTSCYKFKVTNAVRLPYLHTIDAKWRLFVTHFRLYLRDLCATPTAAKMTNCPNARFQKTKLQYRIKNGTTRIDPWIKNIFSKLLWLNSNYCWNKQWWHCWHAMEQPTYGRSNRFVSSAFLKSWSILRLQTCLKERRLLTAKLRKRRMKNLRNCHHGCGNENC